MLDVRQSTPGHEHVLRGTTIALGAVRVGRHWTEVALIRGLHFLILHAGVEWRRGRRW